MPRPRIDLPRGARWLLGILAILDMMAVAWLVTPARTWLDETPTILSAVTLGGRSELVLGLAAAGFLLLAGLAVLTDVFASWTRLELGLGILGAAVSIAALAGVVSTLLLLVTGALVLGFVARPLRRR